MNTKYITRASIIAAIYVVFTLILGDFSYGPIQFRIAEALVLIPFIDKTAILGVYVGCMIANIFGGYGALDIFGGSMVTLIAAYLTSMMPNKYLAAVPPIVLNALIIPVWISAASGLPYWIVAGNIALGEFAAVGILGVIIISVYEKYVVKLNKNK